MFVGQEVQGSSFTHGVKELMFGRSQSLISDCRSIKKSKTQKFNSMYYQALNLGIAMFPGIRAQMRFQ